MTEQLQSELSMGVSDLYLSAINFIKNSETHVDVKLLTYLYNRVFYYKALAYINMKNHCKEDFEKTGQNFGDQIAYLRIALNFLRQGENDIVKFS
jgi:hypothetical protein